MVTFQWSRLMFLEWMNFTSIFCLRLIPFCHILFMPYTFCLSLITCVFEQISALKGKNIDDLLETVMLVAEVSQMCIDVEKLAWVCFL